QVRDGVQTVDAPGAPEVDKHQLAVPLPEFPGLAVDVVEGEVAQGLAHELTRGHLRRQGVRRGRRRIPTRGACRYVSARSRTERVMSDIDGGAFVPGHGITL